jgi:hypothetical protein
MVSPMNDSGRAFDHGARSRFNAWFFHAFDRYINHSSRRHKQGAFAGLDGRKVLEIGAGVGANLDYLSPGTELIALEPAGQRPFRCPTARSRR